MITLLPEEIRQHISGEEIHLPAWLFKNIVSGKYIGCKGWELFEKQDEFIKIIVVTFPKLNFIINETVYYFKFKD
jgi:hypothetical protein